MDRLRSEAGRVTRSRRVVLEALVRLQRPSTPKQIAGAVGGEVCDLATVYRSLKLFERMGLVQRVELGDGLARFEIADDDVHGHHHHHLICRECGRIVKLEDCILADVERALARRYAYAEVRHRLEFFGICPDCQQAKVHPRKRGRPHHD